jgi:hypothetical protein
VKVLFLFIAFMLAPPHHAQAQLLKEKILIGRVEWVQFPELKLKYRSRVDTGAKTTSLHAVNISEVQQQGELYVKFQTEDIDGGMIELTRKVNTTQKVANTSGVVTKRYVIKEKVKLGSIEKDILINLNDRTRMEYKLLVGRNFLLGRFIVDVARSHVLGD